MGTRGHDEDEAFEALFRREAAGLVRALVVLSGDRQSAADAVQDAFLQAYRHWKTVSALDSPAAWVRRAAVNRIRNQHRGRRRLAVALPRIASAAPGPLPPSTSDDPAAAPAFDDRVAVLDAVGALPDQQRAVVVLYYLLDQPTEAVAESLGLSDATVRSHLRHARRSLGDALKEVTP